MAKKQLPDPLDSWGGDGELVSIDSYFARAKRSKSHHEHEEQKALFVWVRLNRVQIPELRLFHSVPNGGKRPQKMDKYGNTYSPEGKRMKEEGQEAGIPDTHLPVARQGFHSLYIEMKYGKNKVSPEQEVIIALLRQEGNRVEVCYSWIAAKDVLLDYLGMPADD